MTIPQFKINFDKSLIQILRTLGIKNAFNKQTANFSGALSDQSNRRLRVPQEVFLETSEESTEAAAATWIDKVELQCYYK